MVNEFLSDRLISLREVVKTAYFLKNHRWMAAALLFCARCCITAQKATTQLTTHTRDYLNVFATRPDQNYSLVQRGRNC